MAKDAAEVAKGRFVVRLKRLSVLLNWGGEGPVGQHSSSKVSKAVELLQALPGRHQCDQIGRLGLLFGAMSVAFFSIRSHWG